MQRRGGEKGRKVKRGRSWLRHKFGVGKVSKREGTGKQAGGLQGKGREVRMEDIREGEGEADRERGGKSQ